MLHLHFAVSPLPSPILGVSLSSLHLSPPTVAPLSHTSNSPAHLSLCPPRPPSPAPPPRAGVAVLHPPSTSCRGRAAAGRSSAGRRAADPDDARARGAGLPTARRRSGRRQPPPPSPPAKLGHQPRRPPPPPSPSTDGVDPGGSSIRSRDTAGVPPLRAGAPPASIHGDVEPPQSSGMSLDMDARG
jgi:hypothetical protein